MKKILGLVLAVIMMVGAFEIGNAQEKTMTDVNMVNDYAYEVSYSNGEKEKVEFDNELDAVEEYSNVWYDINGEKEELKMVDVEMVDDFSYEIKYNDGSVERFEFDTEIDAVEEYSNVWYEIHGDEEEKITMTDVKSVDENSVMVSYSNGEEEKITYDSELECAEEYSELWYEINGEKEETKISKVNLIDDFSYEIVYEDGEKTIHTFDTELECAEEYSNVWYDMHEM